MRSDALASLNGGGLLVALMDALRANIAFGVIGENNRPLVDAVSAHRRFVAMPHEAGAVSSADGMPAQPGSSEWSSPTWARPLATRRDRSTKV